MENGDKSSNAYNRYMITENLLLDCSVLCMFTIEAVEQQRVRNIASVMFYVLTEKPTIANLRQTENSLFKSIKNHIFSS